MAHPLPKAGPQFSKAGADIDHFVGSEAAESHVKAHGGNDPALIDGRFAVEFDNVAAKRATQQGNSLWRQAGERHAGELGGQGASVEVSGILS